jgi:hypothetical protein
MMNEHSLNLEESKGFTVYLVIFTLYLSISLDEVCLTKS